MAPATLRRPTRIAPRTLVALVLLAAACSPDTAAPVGDTTVDREVFIATYVDLRAAVIRAEGFELSDEARATVLSRHSVTEEDLLGFAEFHGEDVAYMRAVWDEVEARMDAIRVLPGPDEAR